MKGALGWLDTEWSFVIVILVLTGGFIWTTFYPNAPYGLFATALGGGFGIYAGKRLMQKQDRFNPPDPPKQ